MTSFTFLVPDGAAARFDQIAEGQGGRSTLLRRLVTAVVDGEPSSAPAEIAPRAGRADQRIELLLTEAEVEAIGQLASGRGMKRSAWLVSLVRRRLHRSAEPAMPEAKSLEGIRSELRRIGVNINQIAQAHHLGQGRSGDLGRLEALVAEIRASVTAVGAARRGDLSYWEVAE
ncbi:MobC family plasmid mobilization relaxosome protein [Sphingomonas sp. SRS2]|uniref:MobC family plasmid mobilization relaxosome protein n=1 Tax=Sphingomonas sp. SRS2 TaxID=133190 RepID=UPI00061842CA|nr:MobC family plasmid mobilization relaxosome protein [Sphingomonas sp. SRS2]KKC24261.1 hypothetical protein WP12_20365 [Sphingomonas sp. SRS2]